MYNNTYRHYARHMLRYNQVVKLYVFRNLADIVSMIKVEVRVKERIKVIWYELLPHVSREQSFLLFLYLAFTACLKNKGAGTYGQQRRGQALNKTDGNAASGSDMVDLMQLGEILRDIPEQELRQAVNDFEESIAWKVIIEDRVCRTMVRELMRIMDECVLNCDDLEMMIISLEELVSELDSLQFTPDSVNRLLAALPVNRGTKSIAELYCGLAGTGLMIHDRLSEAGYRIRMVCEEQRKLYCDISRIRMFCHGIENPRVFRHDILSSDTFGAKEGFDLVVADLPKGNNRNIRMDDQEKLYTEWLAICKILERVDAEGKAMILVTKGALVRQREKELRQILTEKDWLEAVITLPVKMYASTHLGFELLVINKRKQSQYKDKVFMVDINEQIHNGATFNTISQEMIIRVKRAYEELEEHQLFSTVVSLQKIKEKDFSWNPFLYLQGMETGRRTVRLGEIAEIMRGAQITKEEESVYAQRTTHYWLNIRDIDNGNIIFRETSRIRAKASDWERKFGIQEDDIIMTSKGSVLKLSIVTPGMPKAFLCGNLTRIRVDQKKYSPYVLYEFLNSEEGRTALNSIQSGTTIKVLNNTNLKGLQIPYYENAGELEEQLKQAYEEYRIKELDIRKQFEMKRKRLLDSLQ